MGDKSGIEWTDATWSPVTGCTKYSDGCKHCWAKHEVVTRWSKNPKSVWFGREFEDVQCHADKLDQPLHWKKPRRIFVCPQADLFHEDVDDVFLDRVFAVMALAPQHTFQLLTKRAKRMRAYVGAGGRAAEVFAFMRNSEIGYWAGVEKMPPQSWPLRNAWLGVSVEDQGTFDERVEHLGATPAGVRFVSCEPLLEEIDTGNAFDDPTDDSDYGKINWVIAGGESGPDARPSHPGWFRSLRDQCADAGVPFFFKQWGEWAHMTQVPMDTLKRKVGYARVDDVVVWRGGKKQNGRFLDGREHSEFPT